MSKSEDENGKVLNIVEIAQNDDIKLLLEYIEITGNVDHLHINTKGGEALTTAWISAYFGARKILSILVSRGANINYCADNVSVRKVCLAKREALLGLFEGGVKPEGTELFTIFLSDFSNDIPRTGTVELLDAIIRENPDILYDVDDAEIKALILTPAVQQIFPDFQTSIDFLTSMNVREAKKLEDSTISMIRNAILTIHRASMLLCENPSVFDDAIIKRFRGYKKNKSWLIKAATQARHDISSIIAPTLDLYEDDEDLALQIDLIIARYPIRERIAGIPDANLPKILNGTQFETVAAALLSEAGFEVDHIGTTGDQGADLIARKEGLSFAIQCKDYSAPVGNGAVQQALSAKAYYQADYAAVCAPNGFTKSAKSLGSTAGVILITPTLLPELYKLRVMVD